ncbi:MAG: cation:proton antiporter [Bacteroidetes bacterium]|nr:cation:proton antiporter [Bacteroidota bacterium]
MVKKIAAYLLSVGVPGALICIVIEKGNQLPAAAGMEGSVSGTVDVPAASSPQVSLGLVLLQLAVIVLLARGMGSLARRFRQPSVVGEMAAGLCLGPSLLGQLWPQAGAVIFPESSLKILYFISQIGLIFFMFVVGMALEADKMKYRPREAVMISHASIAFPFFLGVLLAYRIYASTATSAVRFLPFALFIGISMSITAFPVLVRIVRERGLEGSPLGQLAITCAAADDVTAWCLLAVVISVVKHSSIAGSLSVLGMAIAYIAVMWWIVKPLLAKAIDRLANRGQDTAAAGLVLAGVIVSAWATEAIGIHALFGGFFAGIILPANAGLRKLLAGQVEPLCSGIFLPVFFAYAGLHVKLFLLGQQQMWMLFCLILLVAVTGKLGGSAFTARLMGQSWTDALSIGILMNARGLMELVVLNIGYELGILSPAIYTLLVLMALITTFMTGPLLNRIRALRNGSRFAAVKMDRAGIDDKVY